MYYRTLKQCETLIELELKFSRAKGHSDVIWTADAHARFALERVRRHGGPANIARPLDRHPLRLRNLNTQKIHTQSVWFFGMTVFMLKTKTVSEKVAFFD